MARFLHLGVVQPGVSAMNVVSSVDRLISGLEAFKATVGSGVPAANTAEFEALFSEASSKLDQLTTQGAVQSNVAELLPEASGVSGVDGFADLHSQNWLVETEAEGVVGRPNMRELMDRTGLEAADASELLYGVIGSNADLRDWSKIMSSANPVDAARAATRQLYNSDKEYSLVKHEDYGTLQFEDTLAESSLSSRTVLRQDGNFAEIETPAATSQLMAVSSTGLLLRGAGSTPAQVERTAWLFGFDVPDFFA
jgi:hypothetical protein